MCINSLTATSLCGSNVNKWLMGDLLGSVEDEMGKFTTVCQQKWTRLHPNGNERFESEWRNHRIRKATFWWHDAYNEQMIRMFPFVFWRLHSLDIVFWDGIALTGLLGGEECIFFWKTRGSDLDHERSATKLLAEVERNKDVAHIFDGNKKCLFNFWQAERAQRHSECERRSRKLKGQNGSDDKLSKS